jgi:hypothetical protein
MHKDPGSAILLQNFILSNIIIYHALPLLVAPWFIILPDVFSPDKDLCLKDIKYGYILSLKRTKNVAISITQDRHCFSLNPGHPQCPVSAITRLLYLHHGDALWSTP